MLAGNIGAQRVTDFGAEVFVFFDGHEWIARDQRRDHRGIAQEFERIGLGVPMKPATKALAGRP